MRAAGGAEQVAVGVHDQAPHRRKSIGQVSEAGQGDGGAGVTRGSLHDLKYGAAIYRAAAFCRPEQVAAGIGDQAPDRHIDLEVHQCGGRAGVSGWRLRDFEHRAAAVRAAKLGRAEKVAVGIGDQARDGRVAVGAIEADQRGRGARVTCGGLRDLKQRAVGPRSRRRGRLCRKGRRWRRLSGCPLAQRRRRAGEADQYGGRGGIAGPQS